MKAELKEIYCSDVDGDLESFVPERDEDIYLPFQLMIGAEGEKGADTFSVLVAFPQALMRIHGTNAVIPGRHLLIVFEYDYHLIINKINDYISTCTGESWDEVANKLARFGDWEFEDYVDYEN